MKIPMLIPRQQAASAAVLDAFDELIEINERRIELLEELARSLYREWFVRFRFPGHEGVEVSASAQTHPIPEGWEARAAGSAAGFVNGYAFKPSDWSTNGRPIIKIKELKHGVAADTPRYPNDDLADKYSVEPGDLLFSWSADLGIYLWPGEPGVLNQHLFKVTPGNGMSRELLFHALVNALPEFQERAQGTTMKHIKRSALMEVNLVVPDQKLMKRFTSMVAPLHDQCLTLRQAMTHLATTRDLLLPRLVTGRLDISDIDLGDLLPAEAV